MLNLGRVLISLVLFVSFLGAKSLVDVKVSDTTVPKGSVVSVDIIAHGKSVEFPNILDIDGSPVLAKHQSMKIFTSNINGKRITDNQKILRVEFGVDRDLLIPAFEVKVDGKIYKSEPISIHTTKAVPLEKKPFYLKFETQKDKVMVDEAFVASVYFVVKDGVVLATQPEYNPPKFNGFFVSNPIQKNYKRANYNITRIDYLLSPKAEGNYTITPPSAKIAIHQRVEDPFFGFTTDMKWHSLSTKPLSITVVPKPLDVSLVGDFKIVAKLDRDKTKANKPVNLKVEIVGSGSVDSLDLAPYDIDGVSVFSDDATVKTSIENSKIKVKYSKTYAFISSESFDIPKVVIKAYNPTTKEKYDLVIPSYHIDVMANRGSIPTQSSSTPIIHTDIKSEDKTTQKEESKSIEIASWATLLFSFIFGMVVMYLLRFLKLPSKGVKFSTSYDEALKNLYPHISSDRDVEQMVRELYAKVNGDKSIKIDKNRLKEMLKKYSKK